MKKEYCLAAYTILCWGTLPAVTKLSLMGVSNMQVLFISSLIASLCLYAWIIFSGKLRQIVTMDRSDIIQLTALGFIGNFLYSAFYYAGLRLLPSSDACIINYMWPIAASVCASVILHEKIKLIGWIAIMLSFAGVMIISVNGSTLTNTNLHGVLLCAAGALCYGLFNVLNKKKNMDQLICTAIYFTVTAVCAVPVLLVTGEITVMSKTEWAGMLWLGIIIDASAIFAWGGSAFTKGNAAVISNLAYLTPVVVMIVSYVILGEPIESYAVAGMMFVIGGCMLQFVSKR